MIRLVCQGQVAPPGLCRPFSGKEAAHKLEGSRRFTTVPAADGTRTLLPWCEARRRLTVLRGGRCTGACVNYMETFDSARNAYRNN